MERCVMDGVSWEDEVRVCGSDWSDLTVSSYTDDCKVHVITRTQVWGEEVSYDTGL